MPNLNSSRQKSNYHHQKIPNRKNSLLKNIGWELEKLKRQGKERVTRKFHLNLKEENVVRNSIYKFSRIYRIYLSADTLPNILEVNAEEQQFADYLWHRFEEIENEKDNFIEVKDPDSAFVFYLKKCRIKYSLYHEISDKQPSE